MVDSKELIFEMILLRCNMNEAIFAINMLTSRRGIGYDGNALMPSHEQSALRHVYIVYLHVAQPELLQHQTRRFFARGDQKFVLLIF